MGTGRPSGLLSKRQHDAPFKLSRRTRRRRSPREIELENRSGRHHIRFRMPGSRRPVLTLFTRLAFRPGWFVGHATIEQR